MSPRLFFAVLTSGIAVALAVISLYFLQHRSQLPSGPCISVVENAEFIDDTMLSYRFNGSLTFWPQAQAITAYGTTVIDGTPLHLRRQMKLDLLSRSNNRMVFEVRSLRIDPADQVQGHNVLFGSTGARLFISVKKLNAGEYMYFINDSWIFMCKVR